MTAIAGYPILTDDYERKKIKIAFNPIAKEDEERFAVQTPVHFNAKHWIPDISEAFQPDFSTRKFINTWKKTQQPMKIQWIMPLASCFQ